jgi:CBS domain-containing protein
MRARPVGTLSHLEIVKALGEQGENASIASAMDKDLLYLDADLSLESALKELQRSKKPLALVSSQNALLGVVDIQNVTEFLLIRSAKQK